MSQIHAIFWNTVKILSWPCYQILVVTTSFLYLCIFFDTGAWLSLFAKFLKIIYKKYPCCNTCATNFFVILLPSMHLPHLLWHCDLVTPPIKKWRLLWPSLLIMGIKWFHHLVALAQRQPTAKWVTGAILAHPAPASLSTDYGRAQRRSTELPNWPINSGARMTTSCQWDFVWFVLVINNWCQKPWKGLERMSRLIILRNG